MSLKEYGRLPEQSNLTRKLKRKTKPVLIERSDIESSLPNDNKVREDSN